MNVLSVKLIEMSVNYCNSRVYVSSVSGLKVKFHNTAVASDSYLITYSLVNNVVYLLKSTFQAFTRLGVTIHQATMHCSIGDNN